MKLEPRSGFGAERFENLNSVEDNLKHGSSQSVQSPGANISREIFQLDTRAVRRLCLRRRINWRIQMRPRAKCGIPSSWVSDKACLVRVRLEVMRVLVTAMNANDLSCPQYWLVTDLTRVRMTPTGHLSQGWCYPRLWRTRGLTLGIYRRWQGTSGLKCQDLNLINSFSSGMRRAAPDSSPGLLRLG